MLKYKTIFCEDCWMEAGEAGSCLWQRQGPRPVRVGLWCRQAVQAMVAGRLLEARLCLFSRYFGSFPSFWKLFAHHITKRRGPGEGSWSRRKSKSRQRLVRLCSQTEAEVEAAQILGRASRLLVLDRTSAQAGLWRIL